ncbi:SMI1/KNR4 family protein [Pyxidicoccus xibeiensis]|uniref:SMI1/KNR4 family protein n=1 Tax=Pyxidicoccus xibeiensis TaxID=2906759 RepID=UPI0020A7DC93|nr:SMI1/KNR4 family protein [Pyxidicoccus xibeiensis]MCP3136002.1 SMI1/KNR4 family protein [Pyxidicoccus xibeiensis]
MGGKNKPPALGGLAAAFQKAGLASKEQAERIEAEKQARDRQSHLASQGLAAPGAKSGGSYREQVAAMNAWFAELLRREPDAGARVFGGRTEAVSLVGKQATLPELEAAEKALGVKLPPSFAEFLLELGSVSFLNPWDDATTAVGRLAAASASLEAEVALTAERFIRAVAQDGTSLDPGAPRRLLHVADHENGEAVFALCARRTAAGEAPVFLRRHDEPDELYDASSDFREWFRERLARLQDELQLRLKKGVPL